MILFFLWHRLFPTMTAKDIWLVSPANIIIVVLCSAHISKQKIASAAAVGFFFQVFAGRCGFRFVSRFILREEPKKKNDPKWNTELGRKSVYF
jgi:hypothetical protein